MSNALMKALNIFLTVSRLLKAHIDAANYQGVQGQTFRDI